MSLAIDKIVSTCAEMLIRGDDPDQIDAFMKSESEKLSEYEKRILAIGELEHLIKDAEKEVAEAREYEYAAARAYLNNGRFADPSTAYFYLYYREAKKGLGIDGAISLGECARKIAAAENNQVAVNALEIAIQSLNDDTCNVDVQEKAAGMSAKFKSNIRTVFEATVNNAS